MQCQRQSVNTKPVFFTFVVAVLLVLHLMRPPSSKGHKNTEIPINFLTPKHSETETRSDSGLNNTRAGGTGSQILGDAIV